MKLLDKKRVLLLSIAACYVLSVFISFMAINTPQVAAATSANKLEQMGNKCNKMERTVVTGPRGGQISSGTWGECEAYQRALKDDLGCNDKMFFQKKDPNDSSVDLNEWYTNPERYAACYAKAKAKLDIIASDKCKSMRHGDGVSDSDNWKDCTKEEDRMHNTLGCSDRMYKPSSKAGYFTQDQGALDDCKARVEAAGAVKLLKSDGSRAEAASAVAATGGFTGGATDGEDAKDQADCDVKFSSPLSWIICPVIDLGANLSDFVFRDIVSPLLRDTPVSTDRDDPSFKVWEQFRFLGNLLLIASLLAIVYSQARGGK